MSTATLKQVERHLKQGGRIKLISPIASPIDWGGRIHFLTETVQLDQEWLEAIKEAGPSTSDNHNVHKVGNLHFPTGKGKKKVKMVLVNLANRGDFQKALAWAEQYGLKRTSPRHIFSIGKNKPNLHKKLSMNPMHVASSEECFFGGIQQVCYLWWGGPDRWAGLHWASCVGGSDGWVAFLCD